MIPYDVYFPSQQDKVDGRVCKVCRKYFSLRLALKEHRKICKSHKKNVVLDEDLEKEVKDDELEIVDMRPLISVPQEGGVEKILNLKEWMKSPWALETDC